MQPPRIPLQPRISNGPIHTLVQSELKKPGRPASATKQPGPILQGADLAAFKQCIESNSSMTKIGVLSAAKVALKHVKNAQLADTLEAVAERVGKGKQEKKWVLVDNTTAQ